MIKQKSKENEIKILKEKTIELEEKLHFLLAEKKKQDQELTFQNEEKDKRAAELILANKELVFQTGEKTDRAAELLIADEELAFQTGEKADRAAELLIANKELAYQNKEKDKRAAELIIANKELAFQNAEKEKRAAELLIANKDLVVQSIKKEKMIAEIVSLKDAQLFVEKQLFEKTLISIGDGVISTDEHKNVLFMNRIAEILTGWSKEDAVGKPIYSVFNIISEYNRRNDDDIIEKVIKSKIIHNLANHTILITKDGQEHIIEDSAAPILDKNNNVIGVVVVFRDYSEKWERLKQIEFLNFHDDLTGLYNRRFFEEELMREDVPRNLPLSIIMGDINGLKLVNDSFGHLVGDELLKKTAISIREGCREDEVIARLGGDEFAIILPKCTETQVEQVIERIKESLSNKAVNNLKLSISFGYACKTVPEKDVQELLRESEDSMYKHKLFESSSMRSSTIDLISKTLFEKSERELSHSNRVSVLSTKLSDKLGFDNDRKNLVKLIGQMHDIGKIGIEDKILNKIGLLDNDEFIRIKKHPEIGSRILSSVREFSEISTAVLQHHEKWDGSGYPQGLKGDEIKIEARIIGLADAYDAMTSKRTYGQQKTRDEAIIEILKCSGTQFDPVLAEIFIQMIKENPKI